MKMITKKDFAKQIKKHTVKGKTPPCGEIHTAEDPTVIVYVGNHRWILQED